MKTQLVVTGYIFHENKLLLIHHKKLNLWLPVGGHIEENEIPDEALKREIKEEVGLEIEILNQPSIQKAANTHTNCATPFHVSIHSVGDHDHCSLFYICKAKNPEQLQINKEVINHQWVSKEQLEQEHIPKDVQNIGKCAFTLLKNFIL